MQVIENSVALRTYREEHRRKGHSLGLVPTMGALHNGHLSLLEASKKQNDTSLVTIFVNPLQFNNPSDLQHYPRTLEKDLELLEKAGCDAVFTPTTQDIYPTPPITSISFGALETVMEGAFRPGHFSGVGIVVSKLFNLIQPEDAYFGQKDLQQFLLIKALVADMSFPLQLHCCPILREQNGLAMSSRNQRLSDQGKEAASLLYRALVEASRSLQTLGVQQTKSSVTELFQKHTNFTLDYFECVDGETLQSIQALNPNRSVALCIAAHLEGVRLIDNFLIEAKS